MEQLGMQLPVSPGQLIVVSGRSHNGAGNEGIIATWNESGLFRWSTSHRGTGGGDAVFVDVAQSKSGDIYAAGSAAYGQSISTITSSVSPQGIRIWDQFYTSPGGRVDIAEALTLDPLDRPVVVGSSQIAPGDERPLILAYGVAGEGRFAQLLTDQQQGRLYAVEATNTGGLYVAGRSAGRDTARILSTQITLQITKH